MSSQMKATVFDIERYALYDGPGIRTVVFFKGCPLRCAWCANPESQSPAPQFAFWPERCIGCGGCIQSCPVGALSVRDGRIARELSVCTHCAACVEQCPAEAMQLFGKTMRLAEVMEEILRDEAFYRTSGGGVTFSGGEALLHADFVSELARQCRGRGIHTCMETSGYAAWKQFAKLLPYIDCFLYDIKQTNAALHRQYTGRDNAQILKNLEQLAQSGASVTVRLPVIPGCNDQMENFQSIVQFLRERAPAIRQVDLLPYHRLGRGKYDRLQIPYTLDQLEPPPASVMQQYKRFFEEAGFQVRVGG